MKRRKRLDGKIALITGASRGIGRQIAIRVAAEGAQVVLVARSMTGLQETKRFIARPDTIIISTDLRNEAEINRLASAVKRRVGEIHILINAAGVWHDEDRKFHGPILAETPTSIVHEILDVGLRAPFLLCRLFLPGMIQKRSGKILQIGCGFAGPQEANGWLAYYVANKAIEAFTAGLAAEVRQHEIQVNCLAPWFVASEAVIKFYPEQSKTALDMSEIARWAVKLVSNEADNISGQVVELRSMSDHKGL